MFRQGDVLLKPTKMPSGTTLICISAEKRVVLAEGEATGHAHAIYGKGAKLYQKDNRFFLCVVMPNVKIEHEEHDDIPLPIGDYEVVRQREYSPEEIRNVRD